MAFKMLLPMFSMLLIAKVTLGEIDCEDVPIDICRRPVQLKTIPREIPDFNDYCVAMESHLRCLKEWQKDRIVFFERSDIFEATHETL
ncbi:unnamed protein product [Larinioides sclopetarius]|uniref:Uncharacterized protein n=1 Tax=Larinioides sclopetarius TaxID=280406 RepID=A0AAV2BMH2_9ARAC